MRRLETALAALSSALLLHSPLTGATRQAAPRWTILEATQIISEEGAAFERLSDGSYLVSGPSPAKDVYLFDALTELQPITGFKIEALPHKSMPTGGCGRAGNGNFVISLLTVEAAAKHGRKYRPVDLCNPTANFSQDGRHVRELVDGRRNTGWSIFPRMTTAHVACVETVEDIDYKSGTKLRFRLDFNYGSEHTLGRFRISVTDSPRPVKAPGAEEEEAWAEVQQRINAAIADGVDYLLDHQELDGSWSHEQGGYRTGQTALAVYTLLKSGVRKDHASVRRGVEFLRTNHSSKTYSISCHILALCALGDEKDRPLIAEMLLELCSWQQGGFAYPGIAVDLSNTQYAALALRAGALAGHKIPEKVWSRMADQALKQQEDVRNPYAPAGFSYRPDGNPTGSMTAAGISILAICGDQLSRKRGDIETGKTRGMAWLAEKFDARTNPDPAGTPNERWLHYYLYGMERVGGLLGVERIGEHNWYREGARYLLEDQNGNGSWSTAYGEEQPNSCFALLFLSRATAVSSGVTVAVGQESYGEDSPKQDVSMRAAGDSPLALWISSFGDRVLRELTWFGEQDQGPRVKQVEYRAFGERETDEDLVIARVEADGRKPSGSERYPAQFTFKRPGTYWVYSRVTVVTPPESDGGVAEEVTLDSAPLKVRIVAAPDPMLFRYAGDAGRNLLAQVRVRALASTELHDGWAASQAVDNLQSRAWCSRDDDPKPSLVLDFEEPVKAEALLLSHAVTSDKERTGRITKISVEVNRKTTFVIEMSPDDQRKTEFRFPKKTQIRRLAFLVLETSAAKEGKRGVGLGEIELQ
ncbi:MAG: discoidin domain-containing protein [Planctomycetota bacterium]